MWFIDCLIHHGPQIFVALWIILEYAWVAWGYAFSLTLFEGFGVWFLFLGSVCGLDVLVSYFFLEFSDFSFLFHLLIP